MMSKQALLALASISAASAAVAQSSVTVFGVVDVAVTNISTSGAGSKLGVSNGGNIPTRIGFRGTEDLGGGLSAGFWLEAPLALDTGGSGLAFTRRATVSLMGPFGELRMGRDFSPIWWNISLFDPFAARGVGTSQAVNNFGYNTVYNSNAIGYVLPATLGGWYGQLQYAPGEQPSDVPNAKKGDFYGGRIGYMAGPLNVAASYGKWRQVLGASDVAPVVIGRDVEVSNVVGSWDFGVVKPVVFYGEEKASGPAGKGKVSSWLVGATFPVGAGEIKATVARHDVADSANDFDKFSLGYAHSLSKRTVVYVTAARLSNKGQGTRSLSADGLSSPGNATPGGSSTGLDVGIRHSF
jgi:predicted porin